MFGGLCQVIELHFGKRRPFLFIISHVPGLGSPISLKMSIYNFRSSKLHNLLARPATENWATNFKSEKTLSLLWLCRDVTSSITKQILDPPRPDIWTIKFHPILNRLQITEDTFANIFTFQLWLWKYFFGLSHPCNLH